MVLCCTPRQKLRSAILRPAASPATKMNQKSFFREGIPSTWILLDSQSTIDVFSNCNLLTNIHSTTTTMHIKC
ncbi:hypothetical protein ACHAXN_000085, partial [Cyclotella atomus]